MVTPSSSSWSLFDILCSSHALRLGLMIMLACSSLLGQMVSMCSCCRMLSSRWTCTLGEIHTIGPYAFHEGSLIFLESEIYMLYPLQMVGYLVHTACLCFLLAILSLTFQEIYFCIMTIPKMEHLYLPSSPLGQFSISFVVYGQGNDLCMKNLDHHKVDMA